MPRRSLPLFQKNKEKILEINFEFYNFVYIFAMEREKRSGKKSQEIFL